MKDYEISQDENGYALFMNEHLWTGLTEKQLFDLIERQD